jgi:inward rectifier potassium channel
MRSRLKKRLRQHQRVHIKVNDGRFEIVGIGAWYSYWRDPYHLLLTIPWIGFLAVIASLYLGTNLLFTLAYVAGGNSVANAKSFLDVYFFSVQTLASIGYGAMYPQTLYANIIVTIEAMTSLVSIAVMTGLAFARFSRPTARVVFSQVATVAPHEGIPTLIFRAANQRRNQILEAQMHVYFMRDEVTAEGQAMRKIYDLQMIRSQTPSFTLSWAAMHAIDQSSPLYGISPESLVKTNSSIVISLSGIDETVAQVVYARHIYAAQDILFNTRFVDIIHRTPDGHRYIDYKNFHDVVPLD